jgi:starch phosphorylase
VDRDDHNLQDQLDMESLYNVLEQEIIPLYYDRAEGNLPRSWIGRIKESIRTLTPQFSMRRMVKEYTERLYIPAATDKP